jgi:hypothetical protein
MIVFFHVLARGAILGMQFEVVWIGAKDGFSWAVVLSAFLLLHLLESGVRRAETSAKMRARLRQCEADYRATTRVVKKE